MRALITWLPVRAFSPRFGWDRASAIARLQNDRLGLSRAFYRVAFVMLRAGFFLAAAFALVMPEFIHLVIGDRWRPMLVTFRLMLVYMVFDWLIVLGQNLLLAVGRPRQVKWLYAAQAAFVCRPRCDHRVDAARNGRSRSRWTEWSCLP